MDDIKRSKITRARIAPVRRRIDLQTPVAAVRTPQSDRRLTVRPPRRFLSLSITLKLPSRVAKFTSRLKPYLPARRKHPVIARVGWGMLATLMFATILIDWSS